jgi:hypothetical protein
LPLFIHPQAFASISLNVHWVCLCDRDDVLDGAVEPRPELGLGLHLEGDRCHCGDSYHQGWRQACADDAGKCQIIDEGTGFMRIWLELRFSRAHPISNKPNRIRSARTTTK